MGESRSRCCNVDGLTKSPGSSVLGSLICGGLGWMYTNSGMSEASVKSSLPLLLKWSKDDRDATSSNKLAEVDSIRHMVLES